MVSFTFSEDRQKQLSGQGLHPDGGHPLSLNWWMFLAIAKACQFKEPEWLTVMTDAHLLWAHLQSQMAQGQWTRRDRTQNLNWLELRVVHLALHRFQQSVSGKHILVLMDNMATKSHNNRQGGTRSRSLMQEAKRLGLLVERHLLSIMAEHISGVMNVQTDWLSRASIDHMEWHLHPSLFQDLTDHFGLPVVDLFATPDNAQLTRFVYARFPAPGGKGADISAVRDLQEYSMPFLLFPLFQG